MTICKGAKNIVKENYALGQAIHNLSQQHTLLCEIRNGVLRTLRYVKDVLVELKFPSPTIRSRASSAMSTPLQSTPSPESKPNASAAKSHIPPSFTGDGSADPYSRSRQTFLRGSKSESDVLLE